MSEYTTRQILDMIEEKEGPDGLDLSGQDLSGIDLGRQTIQAELEKARKDDPEIKPAWASNLGGIYLIEANLQRANLSRANLQGAALFRANLQEANLWEADLQGAMLRQADLQGAHLPRANLQGVDLLAADLQGADLAGADLQGANLSLAKLQRAVLLEANLQGAKLSYASFQRATLRRADLQAAKLSHANLQGANLSLAKLQGAVLFGANLQGADLLEANLQEADLSYANLQGADLRRVDLRGVSLHGARLEHTEIDQESLGPAIGEELAKQYHLARDAYLRLKQNFDSLGDYAASAWAYQKERQMEKQCNAPWRARSIYGEAELGKEASPARLCWFYVWHTAKWISDWIVEYLCGYGESAIRVVLWMALSLLGFATYYWRIVAVWLVEPDKGPIGTASSFWHYLIYSLGAFTTTEFAGFQAADDRVRLITGIQAVWGIFLAGLLGFVVANKIRRS